MTDPAAPTVSPSTRFDAVTAVTPDPGRPGTYGAVVDPRWTVVGKPNGGYLSAIAARAAVAESAFEHPVAVDVVFLSSPDTAPVTVEVRTLRRGRAADRFHVRMLQGDGGEEITILEAFVTTATLHPGAVPDWAGGAPSAPEVDAATAVRVTGDAVPGASIAIMDEIDLRISRDRVAFAAGRPSGRGELTGTIDLPGDQEWDPVALLMAIDAFPPATLDVVLTGWVPTMDLTAYVRAVPAPGPLTVRHRAQLIEDGRVDEVTEAWDSSGRLVAQATQLAGIRTS